MEAVGYLYDVRLASYMAQGFCYQLLIHKILTANSYYSSYSFNFKSFHAQFIIIVHFVPYPAIPQQYVLYPVAVL